MWVNNLVISQKKNGKLRICLDLKCLNQTIKRALIYFNQRI